MSRVHDVLMIEDDPEYRRLVERWLGGHYTLHFGTRLDDTWHELERCDLVLLDLGLPDANGMETLVAVRELAGHIPIVVLTGQGDPEFGRRALEAGADAFLPKVEAGGESLRTALIQALARRAQPGARDRAAAARVSTAFVRAEGWLER